MKKKCGRKPVHDKSKFVGEIEAMCAQGVSDAVIAKKVGVSRTYVVNITTDYWNRRMENRPEDFHLD